MSHVPVLLAEMLAALAPADGEVYLDATFGGGGYSRAILEAADCRVIGIDRDPKAIARGAALAAEFPRRFAIREGVFGDLEALSGEDLDGVILDIGVSSYQIDQAERGFSFQAEGPLDMRMGAEGPSAGDAVNQLSEAALLDLLRDYGEEDQARAIVRAICQTRAAKVIETTTELAALVEKAVGGRRGARTHPATKTFQALRILVNDELGELAHALSAAEARLRPAGRLVVVSFHSLEDRMVKQFMAERAGLLGGGSRHLPEAPAGPAPSFALAVRKPVTPSDAEAEANPRARSASLRQATRTSAAAFPALESPALALKARAEWAELCR
jgi:16S rRNA (cytosine1402-N4)-methyltransferase